ncbi:GNAT family N-acetyltransferase [Marinobacter sp. LN3S78]|uniref:GNAT family N-acetyltransferase n=1 Tax=Marinobacter sp. LN3S78 TaxID=3382300 RepID=UPI00387AE2A4
MPATIQTQRLHLRQWKPEDREPFAALNVDPEVMRYFPSPLTRAQSDAMADKCEALIQEQGWGFWALESRPAGRFLGFVGLNRPQADLPFNPCVEIGWRLVRSAWGQGYATEAARAALAFGFDELNLPEIVSFTAVLNTRSEAVMKRLGMVRDRTTFGHPAVPVGSPLREHCLYRTVPTGKMRP